MAGTLCFGLWCTGLPLCVASLPRRTVRSSPTLSGRPFPGLKLPTVRCPRHSLPQKWCRSGEAEGTSRAPGPWAFLMVAPQHERMVHRLFIGMLFGIWSLWGFLEPGRPTRAQPARPFSPARASTCSAPPPSWAAQLGSAENFRCRNSFKRVPSKLAMTSLFSEVQVPAGPPPPWLNPHLQWGPARTFFRAGCWTPSPGFPGNTPVQVD